MPHAPYETAGRRRTRRPGGPGAASRTSYGIAAATVRRATAGYQERLAPQEPLPAGAQVRVMAPVLLRTIV